MKGGLSTILGPHLASKISSGVIWNFASLAFLATSGLLCNLLIVSLADTAALGVFNQAFAIFIFTSQIAVGGVQFSVLRTFSLPSIQQDKQNRDASLCAALVLVLGLSLVVSVVLISFRHLIGNWLTGEEVAQAIVWVALAVVFSALNKTLMMGINGLHMMKSYAVFQSLRYVFVLSFLLLLLLWEFSAGSLPMALALGELCLLVVVFAYYWLSSAVSFRPSALKFLSHIKAHAGFGARGFASGVMIELNTRVDVLMLGLFFDSSTVGVYSFAATLAEGMRLIGSVVRWNIDPVFAGLLENKEYQKIRAIVRQVRVSFVPALFIVVALSVAFYLPALSLLGVYDTLVLSFEPFVILSSGAVLSAFFLPFFGLLLQGGLPGRHSLLNFLVLLVNVGFNYWFIPRFGMTGAALASTIAWLFEGAFLTLFVRAKLARELL